jgi:hypothetical protein
MVPAAGRRCPALPCDSPSPAKSHGPQILASFYINWIVCLNCLMDESVVHVLVSDPL